MSATVRTDSGAAGFGRDADAAQALKDCARETFASHPFIEPWWLRGSHAQTLYPVFFRNPPEKRSVTEHIATPDGDFLELHIEEGQRGAPVAVLLHGLEGSCRSKYLLGLHERIRSLGWTAVTMVFRSCGDTINRARRMYHLGETTDLDYTVSLLRARFHNAPIYLSGTSLGGNVLLKWLGEVGGALPQCVVAAATVSAPYDLVAGGPFMDRPVMWPYRRHFLRTLIAKAVEKHNQYPGCMDIEKVIASTTFAEFDTHATAALHGFKDCWDYWERCSCGQFLSQIRIPVLLISARNDPFTPESTLPSAVCSSSPWLIPQFESGGGHAGFVAQHPSGGIDYWAESRVAQFFAFCEAMRPKG